MEYLTKEQLQKLPNTESTKYLEKLKTLDKNVLWKQPTSFWETTEDLHYRVVIRWMVPMEDLNKFDKFLVRLYEKASNNFGF